MSQRPSISTEIQATRLLLHRKRMPEDEATESENQPDAKRLKHDLAIYSNYMQKEVSKLVTEILVSIYYDINYVCIMGSSVRLDPDVENATHYRLQFRESVALLDRVVDRMLNPAGYNCSDPRGTLQRLEGFVTEFGWKMLSICMAAEGFRRACREIRHGAMWRELMEKVRENQWSIEVFARSRNLDWRGQLLKYAHMGIPKLDAELRPARKLWEQHPHHVVQSLNNKKVRRPWFEGNSQIHIDEPVFDPGKWDGETEDPTIRKKSDGECDLCGSVEICDCKLDFSAGSLVELVERPVTGTGVRALTSFKRGDILGQFLGEIYPPDYNDDGVYSLVHASKVDVENILAIISPLKYGNWTRYIAHSCRASTKFEYRTVGKRTVMTVEASRDISAFEDLTVDYGAEYWARRECMCGETNCVSR